MDSCSKCAMDLKMQLLGLYESLFGIICVKKFTPFLKRKIGSNHLRHKGIAVSLAGNFCLNHLAEKYHEFEKITQSI